MLADYGLDYCSTQLQNPFIAEFGDVQLDGRFSKATCDDIDMLLLPPSDPEKGKSYHPDP